MLYVETPGKDLLLRGFSGLSHSVPTIKRWFGEFVGYLDRITTNGIVEGINNKLKLLNRCNFAFRNFINFEIRALLFWHFPKYLAY